MSCFVRLSFVLILTVSLLVTASSSSHAQFFRITSSTPTFGATDVPLNTPIVIHFSESINTHSVPACVFFEGTTTNTVASSITYSDDERTMTITPRVPLKPGTFYVVYLQGIQSTSSTVIAHTKHKIEFTTKGGHLNIMAYVTPSELTLPGGGYKEVTYSFIETGGGLAQLVRDTLIYEDMNGMAISRNVENINIIVQANQTTKYRASISIPNEIGNLKMGQTIIVRRIFEGLDHSGNRLEYRTGVRVNITGLTTTSFTVKELSIRLPEYGMVVPKDSMINAEARIKVSGSGDLHGTWNIDGQPKVFFVVKSTAGESVQVTSADKAFAEIEGKHTLNLQLISPEKKVSEEIVYIVCSSPVVIPILLCPSQGAAFGGLTGSAPIFRWSMNPSAVAYKIAIGKNKDLKNDEWIRVETNAWTPNWVKWSALGSGTFYWSVKPIFYNEKEGPASEASSFTISTSK